MNSPVFILISAAAVMFIVIGGLSLLAHYYTLNGIKSRTVGDDRHGTARFSSKQEIKKIYQHIPFRPSQSLQMMERPLMTADELKSIPKGSFVVMKTGTHPMKTKLRLFLDWGITFDGVYTVPEKSQRKVAYADKQTLEQNIVHKHSATMAVYMYLKDRTGAKSDCWPAVNTIASDMSLSRSTVKRTLNDLVKAGLIEKESRYRENGSHTSNRLILK